jgi:hypothetical protein
MLSGLLTSDDKEVFVSFRVNLFAGRHLATDAFPGPTGAAFSNLITIL